ncbi:hypothetical protein F7R91_33490 [Streptomyces luteolifulvus]|uniref:Uncharacterized protein n=1 Tax=Streptomyces luteolifulvus TaxID=2615112 RepID=A0A6H9UQV5_9ACTN|nr:hypothetical protein [Streptomyces luteolifulvus]KAB1141127.1 hypothetical protein F7R91_33490 [Streptomyces luteolifulvus]
MRTPTEPALIPYITQREGEEPAPNNLVIYRQGSGLRLYYRDEDPRDRDLRGTLWARCGFTPVDERKQPTGAPQWKLMHPHRQLATMQMMRCQVCTEPARTLLGYIFLAGPNDQSPNEQSVLTNQPPVCPRHARAAAKLCPHLTQNPVVFLAQSAPLYGVHGTLYGLNNKGVHVVAQPDSPLPYGHPNLDTFLASQLVRRLAAFRVVDLEELLRELRLAA